MVWVRAEWRRLVSGTVGLVLLTGFAGAVVLTVAAGARRTSTTLERFADEARSADVAVDVGGVDPGVVDRVAALPMVAESGAVSVSFAVVAGVDEDIGLFIPHGSQVGGAIERDRVLRGRRPSIDRPDEVAINELAARLAGVDVGDDLTVGTLSPEQVDAEDYFPPRGPELDLHVVGVTRGPGDLVDSDQATIVASPALLEIVDGRVDVFRTYLGVRLEPAATVAEFDDALHQGVPEIQDRDSLSFAVRTKPARDAISALAVGLAFFTIIAAVASLVLVGQAVGRHLASTSGHLAVLEAIGMPRWARLSGLVLLAGPIAVGGATIAVVGAVAASPAMPIGLARRAEPDPGWFIDGWIAAVGFAAVVAAVVGSAALSGWGMVRGRRSLPRPTGPSLATAAACRVGVGPAPATGVWLAFDRRPPAIPVRSALGGVTVAVLGVSAALIFSASVDRLVTSPGRWGYPWHVMLNFTSAHIDDAAAELVGDERLTGVARWDSGFSYVNGEGSRAFGLTPLRGDVGFSLRSGGQPAGVDQVVLGPATADELGVTVGDLVQVAPAVDAVPATAHVVGIALFPEIDEGDLIDGIGYYGPAFAAHATVPDLFEASQLVVRIAPGLDRDDVTAGVEARFPDSISGESLPAPPGAVGNLLDVRQLPRWIAAFLAALGLASLAHVLAATVGRRRRVLATLRSLGLTPGQTMACSIWQAVTIGAVGLMAGIPLGVIVGRAAWRAVAGPLGVSTDASHPYVRLLAFCTGVLVAATLLAIAVGRRWGRSPAAEALHVE
jgi:hypothetical protein